MCCKRIHCVVCCSIVDMIKRQQAQPGIRNTGNTCFANSIIQCLFSISAFHKWLQHACCDREKGITIIVLENINVLCRSQNVLPSTVERSTKRVQLCMGSHTLSSSPVAQLIRLLHSKQNNAFLNNYQYR